MIQNGNVSCQENIIKCKKGTFQCFLAQMLKYSCLNDEKASMEDRIIVHGSAQLKVVDDMLVPSVTRNEEG